MNHWFIGPTIHKSINLGGSHEWKLIWKNILENYKECVLVNASKSQFYWMLTSCLGKIFLHQNINFFQLHDKLSLKFKNNFSKTTLDTIENSLNSNFKKLIKTFIHLSLDTVKIIAKHSDNTPLLINENFRTIDASLENIHGIFQENFNQLYPLLFSTTSDDSSSQYAEIIKEKTERLQDLLRNQVEQLFNSLINIEKFDSSKLLPDELIQTWNHLGPIFWLWFHITASKLDSLSNLSLKEFFNNIDIFISCGICKYHFQTMRQSDFYKNIKDNLPTDLFIIEAHQRVRGHHFRLKEGDEKFIDKNVFSNPEYIYNLREEYENW